MPSSNVATLGIALLERNGECQASGNGTYFINIAESDIYTGVVGQDMKIVAGSNRVGSCQKPSITYIITCSRIYQWSRMLTIIDVCAVLSNIHARPSLVLSLYVQANPTFTNADTTIVKTQLHACNRRSMLVFYMRYRCSPTQ